MKPLSIGQRKSLSDFLNTVSAAWLTAGIIAPIFTQTQVVSEFFLSLASGMAGSVALLAISLILVKEVNS